MRLTFEVEGEPGKRELPGPTGGLVAFMSFAVSRGFGATHPLIALADRLHALGVRLGPLTTFYDGDTEDSEDVEKLELAWQEAAPLRESLLAFAAAAEGDPQAQVFVRRAGAEDLPGEARMLAEAVGPAAAAGRRVRLEYRL